MIIDQCQNCGKFSSLSLYEKWFFCDDCIEGHEIMKQEDFIPDELY